MFKEATKFMLLFFAFVKGGCEADSNIWGFRTFMSLLCAIGVLGLFIVTAGCVSQNHCQHNLSWPQHKNPQQTKYSNIPKKSPLPRDSAGLSKSDLILLVSCVTFAILLLQLCRIQPLQQSKNDLKAELAEQQREVRKLDKKVTTLCLSETNLSVKNHILKSDLKMLRSELSEKEASNKQLAEQNSIKTEKNEKLRAELNKKDTELLISRQSEENLRETNRFLEQQMCDLRQQKDNTLPLFG